MLNIILFAVLGVLLPISIPAYGDDAFDRYQREQDALKNPATPSVPVASPEIEWVKIPAGKFKMGGTHAVKINEFQLAKTLVTFGQYRKCVAAGACTPAHTTDGACHTGVVIGGDTGRIILPDSFQSNDQPIVCVDWDQAVAFSKWVGGRLPSEAEWEYAALSAGKRFKYPWGNSVPTCEKAVYGPESNAVEHAGCGRKTTGPVCSKPNGNTKQGLCDMTGNAWEWVQDSYHASTKGAPRDGSAWEDPAVASRIIRGGSWARVVLFDIPNERSCNGPDWIDYDIGFRPARSVP
ncbi:MAG: formylglycine-generating enzyme family protein [Elusimicrobiota bacterium]